MKQSAYNFIFKLDNYANAYIGYNSFSNALVLLNQNEYLSLNDPSLKFQDNEVENELRKGHFIVDDCENELELVRERMLRARYNTSTMGLTIAPTMDCNFNCIYCYEKRHKMDFNMDESVQKSIIEFVENYAVTLSRLDVTWYGGEPLLCTEIIDKLSNEFKRICLANRVELRMSIITNGYLLDKDTANHLQELGISFCQITVDGSRDEHNSKRIHIEGYDTYDTILDNACNSSELFQVSIRVNTDKNNLKAIYHVREEVNKKGGEKVIVYPAPIRPEDGCCNEEACFKMADFMDYENYYYTSEDDLDLNLKKYPQLQGNSCCADSVNGFVIAPNGDLYKCWTDIGEKDKCIGNIVNNYFCDTGAIMYSRYDPTRDTECSNCKYLPICMGGCLRNINKDKEDRCIYYDEMFKRYLQKVATVMLDAEEGSLR